MLRNLHVKNLAIIDEVEVDFAEQMNVLTGETGAGKSIIIGSVNLALGQKVPKDIIRKGADYALVELIFELDRESQRQQLEALGLSAEEDELIISRKILPGRSINRINGESVTLGTVRQVADLLIDIHGQNEQQSLLHANKHMEILDRYAKDQLGDLLERMEAEYQSYQQILSGLQEKELPEEERLRELSFMEYELQEITEAHLVHGEEEQLAEQYKLLSNAAEIAEGLGEIYGMTGEGHATASEQFGHALRILHKLTEYDPQLSEYEQQLSELDSLLTDFNRDILDYMNDFETGDGQLEQVEKRLDLVRGIKAKYGATTEQVEAYAEQLQKKKEAYQDYEEHRRELLEQKEEKEAVLKELTGKLTEVRKKAAGKLEKEITKALKDLNFLQVQFQIAIRPLEQMNRHGKDEVEFMLSTNPGMDLRPLGKAASGGELSRVMLAIKAVLAKHDEIPTLIFDEIDVGISGRTAQMVAEKMSYIAMTHQVICISHLAQIAAMADAHYLIQKENDENQTSTEILRLDQEASVRELARILGGVEITESVQNSAAEMKQMAEEVKQELRK